MVNLDHQESRGAIVKLSADPRESLSLKRMHRASAGFGRGNQRAPGVRLVRRFVIPKFPFARLWISSVFGVGVLLSLFAFLAVGQWERRALQNEAAKLVGEQLDKLEITILRSTEVLHSIAALHQARGRLDPDEFHRFVGHALARQPELQAISWNPLVAEDDRSAFEQRFQKSGAGPRRIFELSSSGQLVAARHKNEYVPVDLIEPLERNRTALGYDLLSDASRRESLELARRTRQIVATAPVRLTQSSGQDTGVLVLLPVYSADAPGAPGAPENLVGFAVAVFRVADLVGEALAALKRKGIDVALHDESVRSARIAGNSDAARLGQLTWLQVPSRRWAVAYEPNRHFQADPLRSQSWFVLAAGLAFTLLTTAYLESASRRHHEVKAVNLALKEEVVVRQKAEAVAAAANRAKSDFLANMSHEIRTPLNAILGYTQLMQRDASLALDAKDAIQGIHASGRHLLGLVNEVLDLAKIEAGCMELAPSVFDLRGLGRYLESTFKPLCAQKKLRFSIGVESADGTVVRTDEGKLRQVLINLIGNAVKFTQAGAVFVRIRGGAGDQVHFEVVDTGLGIPPEEQPHVFKPFHQGQGAQHLGGTGLGLSIAQRQVELLGGRLDLDSKRGIGSRFHFTLPLPRISDRTLLAPGPEANLDDSSSLAEAPEMEPIVLPESLSSRLIVAAELHSTTALKSALRDLQQLGPEAERLAEHLRRLMRSYDMDSIQRLLCRVVVPTISLSGSPAAHVVTEHSK